MHSAKSFRLQYTSSWLFHMHTCFFSVWFITFFQSSEEVFMVYDAPTHVGFPRLSYSFVFFQCLTYCWSTRKPRTGYSHSVRFSLRERGRRLDQGVRPVHRQKHWLTHWRIHGRKHRPRTGVSVRTVTRALTVQRLPQGIVPRMMKEKLMKTQVNNRQMFQQWPRPIALAQNLMLKNHDKGSSCNKRNTKFVQRIDIHLISAGFSLFTCINDWILTSVHNFAQKLHKYRRNTVRGAMNFFLEIIDFKENNEICVCLDE